MAESNEVKFMTVQSIVRAKMVKSSLNISIKKWLLVIATDLTLKQA